MRLFCLPTKKHRLFLTGDFNVNIMDNAHPQSRNLEYFQSLFNLKNYVDAPTRYVETRNSCIDLVMTEEDNSDGQSVITSCTPKPTLVQTDQKLIRTTLSVGVNNPAGTNRQQLKRKLRKNVLQAFCDSLHKQELRKFNDESDIDAMWLSWSEKFQRVLDSHLNSTHSITRGRTYLSLTIPKVNRRPGSVSPLLVSSLLWNSLPSLLRTRSMSFLQFRRMLFFVYEGSL